MTVCNFFLQGRCRYGDKCWNEHPHGGGSGSGGGGGGRGGGGGGAYGDYSRGPPPSNRGGGGFGNRVWVNPSQRSGGDYVQPSSFSRGGGGDWSQGGGGGRDTKSSDFSFSSNQNRFSTLTSQNTFDRGGQDPGDENEKHLETIQKDMEIWENSGQWLFSCYSVLKAPISGFVELSAEELRLEYYTGRASGDLQSYANSVQQLANQWRSRVEELKTMNSTTRVALIAELNNPSPQTSSGDFASSISGFGSSAPGFGSTSGFGTGGFGSGAAASSASFSFASPSTGFGSADAQPVPSGFGSAASGAVQPPPPFGSAAPASAPNAASFSFAAPVASKETATGFGSASGFSFSSASAGGFGSGVFASTAAPGTGSFGQPSGAFGGGGTAAAPAAGSTGCSAACLFTEQSELTPDELKEFAAKRFTLGQIPLRPPPKDLLVV